MIRKGIIAVIIGLTPFFLTHPTVAEDAQVNDKPPASVPADDGLSHDVLPVTKWLADGDVLVTNPTVSEVQPSMASAPNGDLYVAVDRPGANSIYIYRSTDGGATWSYFIYFTHGTDSRHPSVAYAESSDGEEWLYIAYEKVNGDDTREVWVMRFDRDDPFGSWDNVKIDGPWPMGSPSEHIQPRITTDVIEYGDEYYAYVTYTLFTIDAYPIYFSRSVDRGLNWLTPVDVTGGSENTGWLPRPDIAFGQAGLFIAFVKPGWTGSEWANQVWVTRSITAGSGWLPPIQLTSSPLNQYHPAVAAAHDTNSVVVVYSKDGFLDTYVEFIASTDGGNTWPLNDDLPGSGVQGYADVEASHDPASSGWFHVAYKGAEAVIGGTLHNIWYNHSATSDPGDWSSHIRVSESATASSTYRRPTIAVDPTKPPSAQACVAWTDDRGTYYDAYFSREWLIFADGFESGDTTAWSASVP